MVFFARWSCCHHQIVAASQWLVAGWLALAVLCCRPLDQGLRCMKLGFKL